MSRILYVVPAEAHAADPFSLRPDVLVVSAGIDRLWESTIGHQLIVIVVHPDARLRAADWFHLQSCYPGIDFRVGRAGTVHTEDL